MPYMVTFTINIPQMLAYIPYMDPMGYNFDFVCISGTYISWVGLSTYLNLVWGVAQKCFEILSCC